MTDDAQDVANGASHARLITLALVLLLISLSVIAAFFGERSAVSFWLVVALLVVPLVITLPGILQRNRRTYAWATLCVTPHFVYALTEVVANPAIRLLAAAMIAVALALTLALVAYLRLTRPQA
ncbi:MAG: DUF2069 domain-containing protein [Gammaproteobacteria bacterium]|jgi:uncharacterized membrane protein|nr:DUF2069 domain-containing protein [Gammaproteobacteria bacterium]